MSLTLSDRKRPDECEPQNLLLVVIDSLRSDHLSRHGYHRETSPFLDSLSALSYPHTISPAPWTYPAVTSILTGLFPHEHGAGLSGVERSWTDIHKGDLTPLADEVLTLPEILRADGYETFGESAITPAELAVGDRFDHFRCHHHRSSSVLTAAFLDWLDAADREKWFGYLHFGDVHGWDTPPESGERSGPRFWPFGRVDEQPNVESVTWEDPTDRDRFLTAFERLYDTQVRHVDAVIEVLFQALRDRGEAAETLVVITGDHGEAFGERAEIEQTVLNHPHGPPYGLTHGTSLFSEVLTVPVLLVGSGLTGEYRHRVSTIDLVPTVLSLLGVDSALSYSLSGEPLGTEPPDRPLFASQIGDGYKQRAVYAGEHKLIRQYHDDVTLLYRLDDRQRERTRVTDPDREAALAATLPDEKWDQPSDSIALAESTKKRLRDLGYVDE